MTMVELHKYCIKCEVIKQHPRVVSCVECSTDWQWRSATDKKNENRAPKYFKE